MSNFLLKNLAKKSRVVQTPVPVGGPPRLPGTCDDLKAQVQW